MIRLLEDGKGAGGVTDFRGMDERVGPRSAAVKLPGGLDWV
jgi:hypothetical protein